MKEDNLNTISMNFLYDKENNINTNDSDGPTVLFMFVIVLIICFFPTAVFSTGTSPRRYNY